MTTPDPDLARQLAWPPRLHFLPTGEAILAEVEQDTPEEIKGGVALLCSVRRGQLGWDETFGIPGILGNQDPEQAADLVERAIATTEDRLSFGVTFTQSAVGRELHLQVLGS